jgi:hypothetical protein
MGGRNLWIDDQAAFVANLPTLAERQHWLGVIAEQAPHYIVRIKQKVKDLFREVKK